MTDTARMTLSQGDRLEAGAGAPEEWEAAIEAEAEAGVGAGGW